MSDASSRLTGRRIGFVSTRFTGTDGVSLETDNVMDFDHPPAPLDNYACDVRAALGVAPDERMFLQPTRVVQRKGIEHAIGPAPLLLHHVAAPFADTLNRLFW